jgi:predicted RNA-binding protein with RPS1 domain
MTSDKDQPSTLPESTENIPAAESPPSPPESGSAADRPMPMRIGSQRWREKNPDAKPKPATDFLVAARTRPAQGQPGSAQDSEGEPSSVQASSPFDSLPAADSTGSKQAEPVGPGSSASSTEPGMSPSTGAEPSSPDSKPPGENRRGRRDRGSKSERVPLVEPTVVRRYPPPNTRAQLTPDLEQELAEALGGLSVEDMLSAEAGAAAGSELEPESRHRARVVAIHRDNVFVDLGGHRQGLLALHSLPEVPETDAILDVVVQRFNAVEGLYEVGLPGTAIHVEDWSQVSEGMVVEARVTGHNKGGLECEVSSLRGFIPGGQVSLYRVEDFSQFVGEKFACVITQANPAKGNLVLSRRAVLEREKAEAKANLLTQLEVGQIREGIVRSLQEFGAFVDLGGVDGLIHISQLSWDRLKHASEALEIGQKVKVKIQKIDQETGKIGLGFRDLAENPWATAAQRYSPRSTVKGTISRIMEFGAFVRLEPGIEGLIHISELSHKRVWRASDIVQEGQEVEVLVLSFDAEHQRISLSLKALEARAMPVAKPSDAAEPEEEAVAKPTAKRKTPLKGGIGGGSGGDKFGLKW